MKKELISDILFGWEKDISSGAGHNHRDSVAKVIIGICQPKWISVDTELPIDLGKVLISYGQESFGVFSPETECAYYEEGQWYFWLSDRVVHTNGVTHWQHLPEPPAKTGDGLPENNQKISFKTITEREGIFIEGLGFYDREGNYYEKEEVLNWEPREKDAETGDVPQIKEWGSKGSPF